MSEYISWFFLLLPIVFGMGWAAARVDIRHLVRESRSLPRSYFRGLNFLLNEQPDEAVEAFQEAVKVDDQTVELHFALGGLFRRRGETERAIRIHQNLIERADLSADLRLQGLYELGLDFQKAGLLDRAEINFNKLTNTTLAQEAKQSLLVIYQQEKNWSKAIEIARDLDSIDSGRNIAEYYCELASIEMLHLRNDVARQYLAAAIKENRRCVRSSMMAGDIAMQEGNSEEAIAAWLNIEQQNPAYLSLVAGRLQGAYRKLGRIEDGLNLLHGFLTKYSSLDLLDVVYQLAIETQGDEAAFAIVYDELQRNPTLLGLEKLLSARLPMIATENRAALELALSIVRGYTNNLARYCCDYCGFKARQFYWCCPACAHWETYPPRRSEEFGLDT